MSGTDDVTAVSDSQDRVWPAELFAVARRLAAAPDRDSLLGLLVDQALTWSGAGRGAVLERVDLDGLAVVTDRDSGLGDRLMIGDVRATLWGVVLGRIALRWGRQDVAPRPFCDIPGWSQGVVVRIGSRHGPPKVLALGGEGFTGDVDVDRLQGLADIAAPSVDSLELAAAAERTRELLDGVTELAGALGAAVSPEELWHALADGLADLAIITHAVLWDRGGPGDPDLRILAGSSGRLPQPHAVETRLRRLLDPATGPAARSLLEIPARVEPGGPLVTLLSITTDPPRVLGLVHLQPLDDLARGVLASLAAATGPALRPVADGRGAA